MKVASLLILMTFMAVLSLAQDLVVTETSGWFESAYVTWQALEDVNHFNVYYRGQDQVEHQIDDQLIRDYGDFYRADVLGLKAGEYTLSIASVIAGQEVNVVDANTVMVRPHDRSGFAFWSDAYPEVNEQDVNDFWDALSPGAYKYDGTPKDGAVILYITQNTKDVIEMDVDGANENPCVGLLEILEGFKKGKDTRPLIVRLVGQITDPLSLNKGDIVIENHNNLSSYITFEGVGNDATADGWGLRLKNATNVEVRNLGFMNCDSDEGDDLGLQQDNEHIWIHHCDFFYGNSGSDADQDKGDGALDCKKSTYVTISYNHFWDTGKTNLLGLGEDTTEGLYITYHHNWYDHSDSRHPRVRFYSAHVYNNYYDGVAKYGVGATMGSSVFVEANYFRKCRYPMLTSMQGSDVYDESTGTHDYSDMPTFSKEDGGSIKAFNNIMIGQPRFVSYGAAGYPNSTVQFDAYVATTRDEWVDGTVMSNRGSNIYNNFDTQLDLMIDADVNNPGDVPERVMLYAGRVNGGDFVWTFNQTTDDTAYEVNEPLKEALASYQTGLVAVQGDAEGPSEDPNDPNDNGGAIIGDVVHNFTESGKTSEFFAITGNLSDSKGTVYYDGLTLTQCLKIESSTLITFTTVEEAELTLVFNDDENDSIMIDGIKIDIAHGTATMTLASGSHEITKSNPANLYLISLIAVP